MPTLHKKCAECGALLGPRNPDVPESILHEKTCRQYMEVAGWEGHIPFPVFPIPLPDPTTQGGADHILNDTWKSTSGASSSKKAPPFHLIPFEALCAEAERFGLGVVKHGRDNLYKALGTPVPAQPYNTEQDWAWMEDRINHGIVHLLRWLLKLEGYIPMDNDDDASAVAWLGTVMYAFQQEWRRRKELAGGERG